MKRVLLFLLLLMIVLPLTAQTSLRQFSELLEWTLGLRFTPAEDAELARIALDDKTAAGMSEAQEILTQLTPDKRREALPFVQAGILKNLRATPDDPSSRFLLHAFDSRRNSTPAGKLPAEVLGDWTNASASTISFVDSSTGASAPHGGDMETYHILPDGTFKGEVVIQSTLYQCTVTAIIMESGNVFVNGGDLIFSRLGGSITNKSTCNSSLNYSKPLELRNLKYVWHTAAGQYGPQLCLGAPGKSPTCFSRLRS